jgi:hypothetical protein
MCNIGSDWLVEKRGEIKRRCKGELMIWWCFISSITWCIYSALKKAMESLNFMYWSKRALLSWWFLGYLSSLRNALYSFLSSSQKKNSKIYKSKLIMWLRKSFFQESLRLLMANVHLNPFNLYIISGHIESCASATTK